MMLVCVFVLVGGAVRTSSSRARSAMSLGPRGLEEQRFVDFALGLLICMLNGVPELETDIFGSVSLILGV